MISKSVTLRYMMEESLQIYELEDLKVTVVRDLHNALKVITSFLRFSTPIHLIVTSITLANQSLIFDNVTV
jgi:hypothetical protein